MNDEEGLFSKLDKGEVGITENIKEEITSRVSTKHQSLLSRLKHIKVEPSLRRDIIYTERS